MARSRHPETGDTDSRIAEPRCPVCGASLRDRRADARTCGAACRRELSRVLRLAAGEPDGPYCTLRGYLDRSARRRGVQNHHSEAA